MKCDKCKADNGQVLQRVNEFGVDGIWWCEPCLKKHEPELYDNTMEDKSELEKDLDEIIQYS